MRKAALAFLLAGTLMAASDLRTAVDGLIQATLDAGAPDNVTVLIAEAFR